MLCVLHDQRRIALALGAEVEPDQPLAAGQEERRRAAAQQEGAVQLVAEGLPDAVIVALAVKLRCEQPRAGHRAENAQKIDEHQLIDNRHAGHLLRAHLPDHHVVKQADEIADRVLNGDRHRDREDGAVKLFAAEKSVHG